MGQIEEAESSDLRRQVGGKLDGPKGLPQYREWRD